MLRRSAKRAKSKDASTSKTARKRESEDVTPLGVKMKKNEEEMELEKFVFGDDEDIVNHLEEIASPKKSKGKKKREQRKPVWEDEDEDNVKIQLSKKDFRHSYFKHATRTEVTGKEYTQTLKNQFEKVSGKPEWAKLKWEKSEDEEDSGNDDEDDGADLLQSTGNYLDTPESLPKGLIQMKPCTDANHESTAAGKVRAVEFHPASQVMLVAGMNHTLGLYQIDGKNNPKIQSVFLEQFPIYSAHFSADGEEVIVASNHNHFYYYDMLAGKVVHVPRMPGMEYDKAQIFKVSPDGKLLAFTGRYGRIHLFSAKAKEWLGSLKMNGTIEAIAFNGDGSRLYSHGGDGNVYVWDMNTRDCVHRFTDHGCTQGTCLAVSHNNKYIAAGSQSGVVNIYDDSCLSSRDPKPLKAIMSLTTPCTSMVFNHNSELLAVASNHMEKAVRLVHLPSYTVFSNFPEKTDQPRIPYSLDFSLNSGYFSLGNNKGRALLYRVKHYSNY